MTISKNKKIILLVTSLLLLSVFAVVFLGDWGKALCCPDYHTETHHVGSYHVGNKKEEATSVRTSEMSCPDNYDPVCAEHISPQGKTFKNACIATSNNRKILYAGECVTNSSYVPTDITIEPEFQSFEAFYYDVTFNVILGGEHTTEDLRGFTATWRWTCDPADTEFVRDINVEGTVSHAYDNCNFGDNGGASPCVHQIEYTLNIPGHVSMTKKAYVGLYTGAYPYECE